MKELIAAIPKSELHVHLRGAMPVPVFAELLLRHPVRDVWHGIPLHHRAWLLQYRNIRQFVRARHHTPESLPGLFRTTALFDFLATYALTGYFVRDVTDLRTVITGVLESLKRQKVVYAEISISIPEYLRQGIPLTGICACLDEATSFPGIRVQWIVDLVRDLGPRAGLALLNDILEMRCRSIVGITLGGSERFFPPARFTQLYAAAQRNGLHRTVHAGEGLGPGSIRDAIRLLGVERIGHGVRAIEDTSLVAHMAEGRIPIEVCPTSNIRTGLYKSYAGHPLKALFEAGVPVSLNTDDPTFFGTTLVDEYVHLREMGLQEGAVLEIIKNGFRHAFLPEREIAQYLTDVDAAWASLAVRDRPEDHQAR